MAAWTAVLGSSLCCPQRANRPTPTPVGALSTRRAGGRARRPQPGAHRHRLCRRGCVPAGGRRGGLPWPAPRGKVWPLWSVSSCWERGEGDWPGQGQRGLLCGPGERVGVPPSFPKAGGQHTSCLVNGTQLLWVGGCRLCRLPPRHQGQGPESAVSNTHCKVESAPAPCGRGQQRVSGLFWRRSGAASWREPRGGGDGRFSVGEHRGSERPGNTPPPESHSWRAARPAPTPRAPTLPGPVGQTPSLSRGLTPAGSPQTPGRDRDLPIGRESFRPKGEPGFPSILPLLGPVPCRFGGPCIQGLLAGR